MLNQIFIIAPFLVQAALAVPSVEPRHQHLHGHMEHSHGSRTTMSTAIRRQAEETAVAAPQFIPPKIGYALKPQTKVAKPTAAAQPDDSHDDIVPGFIPPKMPFVAKTYQQQKSTNEQASPQRLASVASVNDNKKTAAKDSKNSKDTKNTKDNKDAKSTKDTKNTKDTKSTKTNSKNASPQKLAAQDNADDDKLPSFIPPRSPFRGPKKPQPTQSVPRDTVPQFIPPKNPWLPSKFNTRSANGDVKAASQETAVPDPEQRASRADLLRRDEEDEANVDFEEEDDDEFSPSDFPNLGDSEDEESDDVENHDSENLPAVNMSEQQVENEETDEAHNQDSANIPVANMSDEQAENEEAVNIQDEDDAKNYFGGDFDDEDASNTPTRLEARGVAKRNMIYFTNWGTYGPDFQPQDLPVKHVTHVLYSFANVNAKDGTVQSSDESADTGRLYPGDVGGGNNAYGCVKQLYILKKKNRNLKMLLSIGGYNGSPALAAGVSTQAGRRRFIATAVKLITDWGFDGIDVDWEYPTNAQEARNYVLILSELRKALDRYSADNKLNYHFLLTVASPAGSSHYNTMDLKNMNRYIDAWHLMAYDYAGPWDSTTGHQSNVFLDKKNPLSTKLSTDGTLNAYIAAGIPPEKIHMGMALYGRSFSNTAGLGKSYSGTAGNSEGIYLLNELPRPGAKTSHSSSLMASWTYDSSKKELVTMDDLKSGQAKAGYINQRGLGGAFYWEASGDRTGSASVVAGVHRTLGSLEKSQNLLKYPTSKYDNIRNNMP